MRNQDFHFKKRLLPKFIFSSDFGHFILKIGEKSKIKENKSKLFKFAPKGPWAKPFGTLLSSSWLVSIPGLEEKNLNFKIGHVFLPIAATV